jgi:hypothetical protein
MKLIKINTDHYVVVDDDGTRTHSTIDIKGVLPLSLQEVKELIGEVDVETKVEKYTSHDMFWYKQGYNQALEDNKEKKYTEDDLAEAILRTIDACNKAQKDSYGELEIDEEAIIQSFQPKTEWEVEFVDGKLKLK